MRLLNAVIVAIVFFSACQGTASDVKTKTKESSNPEVVLKTNKGEITVEVFEDKAPLSAKNFLAYVNDGFYAGTIFHRVIDGFMIQGGGFTEMLDKKPVKAMVKNESNNGLSNKRGTLAMARTNDPDSATSQFFINVVDNPRLDFGGMRPNAPGYTVFAKVVKGMDVVDEIKSVATQCSSKNRGGPCDRQRTKGMGDVPVDSIVIFSAKVKK